MKKLLVVVVALVAITMIGAGVAMAGVKNTKHDIANYLTTNGTFTSLDGSVDKTKAEICVYCHTPHAANTGIANAPLWNRTGGTGGGAFQAYTSLTMTYGNQSASASTITQLCLSCHDGSLAVWTMGNPPNYNPYVIGLTADKGSVKATTGFMTGNALITNDFRNSHPIGFTYDTSVSAANAILAGSLAASNVITGSTTSALKLVNGKMECSTCHEVHGGVANTAFLRMDNASSGLCTFCHLNK